MAHFTGYLTLSLENADGTLIALAADPPSCDRVTVPPTQHRMDRSRPAWVKLAAVGAVFFALFLSWRYTPLANVITAERVMGWARAVGSVPWAPVAVIAFYTPAALVMFPRHDHRVGSAGEIQDNSRVNRRTRNPRAVIAIVSLCAAAAALGAQAAATPEPAASGIPVSAQPLVHRIDGAIAGCGVRLTGGAPNASAPSAWFDVSINLFRRGVALAQAIAYEMRHSEFEGDSRPARVPVQSAWVTTGAGDARLGENLERRETLVYSLVPDDALSLFEAVARGQSVLVGIKRWGQRTASVYTGTPTLTGETRDEIGDCLAALVE